MLFLAIALTFCGEDLENDLPPPASPSPSATLSPELLLADADSGNATAAYLYSQVCPDANTSAKYLRLAADASVPDAVFALARVL
jgi:hypothetical protein